MVKAAAATFPEAAMTSATSHVPVNSAIMAAGSLLLGLLELGWTPAALRPRWKSSPQHVARVSSSLSPVVPMTFRLWSKRLRWSILCPALNQLLLSHKHLCQKTHYQKSTEVQNHLISREIHARSFRTYAGRCRASTDCKLAIVRHPASSPRGARTSRRDWRRPGLPPLRGRLLGQSRMGWGTRPRRHGKGGAYAIKIFDFAAAKQAAVCPYDVRTSDRTRSLTTARSQFRDDEMLL